MAVTTVLYDQTASREASKILGHPVGKLLAGAAVVAAGRRIRAQRRGVILGVGGNDEGAEQFGCDLVGHLPPFAGRKGD